MSEAATERQDAAAQAALVAALIAAYDAQRTGLSERLVRLMLSLWRYFLITGGASTRSRPGVAVAQAVAGAPGLGSPFTATAAQADALYDETATRALARQMAEASRAAQVQAFGLSAQFQRELIALSGERPPQPRVPDVIGRLGVAPEDVYLRPAGDFRYLRSLDGTVTVTFPDVSDDTVDADDEAVFVGGGNGLRIDVVEPEESPAQVEAREHALREDERRFTIAEAERRAEDRLIRLAEDDVMLAARDGAFAVIQDDRSGVTGYRRVPRPELARFGSCGLCIVAADRVYSKEYLLPLHARCNCLVVPIVNGNDPGLTLNEEDLKELYGAAGAAARRGQSTAGKDLKRIRTQVNEHGEMGPVLRRYGHGFLTPEDIAQRRSERRARTRTAPAASA